MLLLSKEDIRKVVTMADIIEGNKVATRAWWTEKWRTRCAR